MKKTLIIPGLLLFLLLPAVSSAQTVDVQTRIAELQQLIQQLQAQLTRLQTEAQNSQRFCHTFNVNLKFDDRGSEVESLQTALTKEGFTVQESDGSEKILGEATASGVTGFQEKYKSEILTPFGLQYGTGYVGAKTRAKLNNLYACSITPTPASVPVTSPAQVPATTHSGTGIPTVTIISPNGGEILRMGTLHNISWRSQNLPANTKVSLYLLEGAAYNQSGTYIQTITTNQPNTGVYSWLVPTIEAATNLRIELRTTLEGVGDISDRDFSILQPLNVTIVQPNGGEVLRMGNSYQIYWAAFGFSPGATANLYLLEGGTPIQTIATNLPVIPGIYTWIVPQIEAATNLRIKITTSQGVSDQSNGDFSIMPPISVRLTQPNGGEVWLIGGSYYISWLAIGFSSNATVSLYLLEGGTTIQTIATNIPNSGLYAWTVPSMEQATNLRIEIRTSVEGVGDQSDADFSILCCYI